MSGSGDSCSYKTGLQSRHVFFAASATSHKKLLRSRKAELRADTFFTGFRAAAAAALIIKIESELEKNTP